MVSCRMVGDGESQEPLEDFVDEPDRVIAGLAHDWVGREHRATRDRSGSANVGVLVLDIARDMIPDELAEAVLVFDFGRTRGSVDLKDALEVERAEDFESEDNLILVPTFRGRVRRFPALVLPRCARLLERLAGEYLRYEVQDALCDGKRRQYLRSTGRNGPSTHLGFPAATAGYRDRAESRRSRVRG